MPGAAAAPGTAYLRFTRTSLHWNFTGPGYRRGHVRSCPGRRGRRRHPGLHEPRPPPADRAPGAAAGGRAAARLRPGPAPGAAAAPGGAAGLPAGAAVLGELHLLGPRDPGQPAGHRADEHGADRADRGGRRHRGPRPRAALGAGLGARRRGGTDRRDRGRRARRGPAPPHRGHAAGREPSQRRHRPGHLHPRGQRHPGPEPLQRGTARRPVRCLLRGRRGHRRGGDLAQRAGAAAAGRRVPAQPARPCHPADRLPAGPGGRGLRGGSPRGRGR